MNLTTEELLIPLVGHGVGSGFPLLKYQVLHGEGVLSLQGSLQASKVILRTHHTRHDLVLVVVLTGDLAIVLLFDVTEGAHVGEVFYAITLTLDLHWSILILGMYHNAWRLFGEAIYVYEEVYYSSSAG
jgi:hypothetical protein